MRGAFRPAASGSRSGPHSDPGPAADAPHRECRPPCPGCPDARTPRESSARAGDSAKTATRARPRPQIMHVQTVAIASYGGVMGRDRPSLEDHQIILGLAEMRLVTGAGKFLHVRVTASDPYPKHARSVPLAFCSAFWGSVAAAVNTDGWNPDEEAGIFRLLISDRLHVIFLWRVLTKRVGEPISLRFGGGPFQKDSRAGPRWNRRGRQCCPCVASPHDGSEPPQLALRGWDERRQDRSTGQSLFKGRLCQRPAQVCL